MPDQPPSSTAAQPPNSPRSVPVPLTVGRRAMLGSILKVGAGGLAAGVIIAAGRSDPPPAPAPASTPPAAPPPKMCCALGPGGQLMQVDMNHAHAGSGAGGMPMSVSSTELRRGDPNRKWVMVIDLARCDGCAHCIEGCNKMHFLPADRQWIKVLRRKDAKYTTPYYFPQPCYHCDNPPCTKVCPVDATFKRQDGTVLIDNERCIGCRFCIAGCPYGVRVFNWGHPEESPAATQPYSPEHGYPRRVGTVEKCDFCPDMGEMGKLPGCVTACPMGVIYYGDQNEDAVTNGFGETVRFSAIIRDHAAYRDHEELGTEPRVYYLPPTNRLYPPPPEPPPVELQPRGTRSERK